MRLPDFILENLEPILQAWEDFARTIETPGVELDNVALRDHAEQMLRAIVIDLRTKQTMSEQIAKAQGQAPRDDEETAAETHAVTRLMAGFTIDQMVSEYRALRTGVLSQWLRQVKDGKSVNVDDMTRFHEAIDQALAESIASYSRAVEASRNGFLGILGHDLRTPLGAILLGADMLRRTEATDPRTSKVARQIYASVQRASQIVGDLLDLTRCQMGPGDSGEKIPDRSQPCVRAGDRGNPRLSSAGQRAVRCKGSGDGSVRWRQNGAGVFQHHQQCGDPRR